MEMYINMKIDIKKMTVMSRKIIPTFRKTVIFNIKIETGSMQTHII